jgi:hypothetical protein
LLRETGYFKHNQHRMDYLEMRIQGWGIGSVTVESAAKQFKARLAGPGHALEQKRCREMLCIRSSILSDRFHQTWHNVYYSHQIYDAPL